MERPEYGNLETDLIMLYHQGALTRALKEINTSELEQLAYHLNSKKDKLRDTMYVMQSIYSILQERKNNTSRNL